MTSNKHYKVSLLGDTYVGKTAIVTRITLNEFNPTIPPTIGAAFTHTTIPIPSKNIELNIWDTAGQERYNSLVPLYIRDAFVIIFVFDVSKPRTLHNIENVWIPAVLNNAHIYEYKMYLVGNKCDLVHDEFIHSIASDLAIKHNMTYHKVSSKANTGVKDMIYDVAINLKDVEIPNKLDIHNKTNNEGYGCCVIL